MPKFGDIKFIKEQRETREMLRQLSEPGQKFIQIEFDASGCYFSLSGDSKGTFTGVIDVEEPVNEDNLDLFLSDFEEKHWDDLSDTIIENLMYDSNDSLNVDEVHLKLLKVRNFHTKLIKNPQISMFNITNADKKNT